MPEHFLSAEEYDERAHSLYSRGDYDGALETLKEGLALYPTAVALCVGLGYARLAREEYAWARRAFERALGLEPNHEDALVGLGEVLLRLGHREEAQRHFRAVEGMGFDDDPDLMLSMGRALYREGMLPEARSIFARLVSVRPDHGEAMASLGYTLYRLGDAAGACRYVRQALRLDPDLDDARIFLGHFFYERGDWGAALREFERVPPQQHWDPLAVWRVMEIKRNLLEWEDDDPRLAPWLERLRTLERVDDPIEQLLQEVETAAVEGEDPANREQLDLFRNPEEGKEDDEEPVRRIRLPDGHAFRGTWYEIVAQLRDHHGFSHEPVAEFMRRLAERWREEAGVEIPLSNPEAFFRAAAEEGLVILEE